MKLRNFFPVLFILIACQNSPTKAQNQTKTLVGVLENDKAILTLDKSKLLVAYNANLLKLSGIDAKFTEVSIKTTSDKQYFLVFKGNTYSSSFIVTADNSTLYVIPTISCTTSECASEEFGCTPKASGGACWPCNNKGKCTKTVTDGSMIE